MKPLATFATFVWLTALAHATTIVHTGGPYIFAFGTTGNVIAIYGTNDAGDQAGGMNFVLGIGDQQSSGTPIITSVDLITGTVFAGNNTGQNVVGSGAPGLVVAYSITTASGTVSTAGLLATVTISTVGALPGIYPLYLKKNVGFPQPTFNFAPTTITRDDFSTNELAYIFMMPEPSTFALAGIGLAGVVYIVRRGRKHCELLGSRTVDKPRSSVPDVMKR